MREAAPLLLLAVLALLAIEPEAAQLGLDLLLPTILDNSNCHRLAAVRRTTGRRIGGDIGDSSWWLLLL